MEAAALVIFVITLILVIWQPKGLNIAWSASGGAVLALLFGIVDLADAGTVVGIVWNATLTLIALIIISLVLDEIGFFEWAALHMARYARGNGMLLFIMIVLLGAVTSALFANDGAILILTPIVLSMMKRLGFTGKLILPFIMAAGFIVDTASLPFIISNLVNILSADFFDVGFVEYASRMIVPNVVSIIASLIVLYVVFRKSLPPEYEVSVLKQPEEAIKDRHLFRLAWFILGALLAAYLISEWVNIPVSLVAGVAALILLLMARTSPAVNVGQLVRSAPWNVVIFSIGMYMVVYGLRNAGFTDMLGKLIQELADQGLFAATLGMGFISGILSSVMNNLPTVMFDALAIQDTQAVGLVRESLIYANVIGSDLGPKMTPIGSLATLLWLHVLAMKQVKIGWGYYFRVGVMLTIPTLFMTLVGLWLWLFVIDVLKLSVWSALTASVCIAALLIVAAWLVMKRSRRGMIQTTGKPQSTYGTGSSA
jgi:arsenical pump membrane protein